MPTPSTRRTLLSSLPNCTHPFPTRLSTSATQQFSTSAPIHNGIKTRPSAEKVAERVRKIDRRREDRLVRAESEQATRMEGKLDKLKRQLDVKQHQNIGEVILCTPD